MPKNDTTWPCGHPRTAENTYRPKIYASGNGICLECRRARNREKARKSRKANPPEYDPLVNRIRYLPLQLEAARRKVAALENEARRYGMIHLLESDRNEKQ